MRKKEQLGASLITALFVLVLVSVIIGIIGYLLIETMKTSTEAQVFKSSKQGAEGMAYAIINEIDANNLSVRCSGTVTNWCPITINGNLSKCEIDLPPDIAAALDKSNMEGYAWLLANCSSGDTNTYTIQVETKAPDGTTARIFFIYKR